MDNQSIYDFMVVLDRKFTTFAQQAGYEFDAEGNATRKGGAIVPKKQAKPRDPVKMAEYDLSSWPAFPDEQLFDDWRAAKKRNKGSVTQTTMKKVGGELCKAAANGFSVNDCLATAESSGWRGFESDWMKKPDTKVKRHSFMELAAGDHLPAIEAKYSQPQIAAPVNAIDQFALEYAQHKRLT